MSLQLVANHLAQKGRGPDSTLVHMSNREVAGLNALAQKHGGQLSVNPDTGLPEAGFLDNILPMVAGAGLTYFSGGAINPLMAGGIIGGITALDSKDLSKGLVAGLGAYGGSGMVGGLAGLGAEAAYMPGAAGEAARAAGTEAAIANGTYQSQVGTGLGNFIDQPMTSLSTLGGGSALKGSLPILAGLAPAAAEAFDEEDEDKPPEQQKGYIRKYALDPVTGQYKQVGVYEAGGDPNKDVTSEAGTAGSYGGVREPEYQQPKGMAAGGTASDSERIYDYLMGRGPNPMQFTHTSSPQVDYTPYMPKPITPTTQILEAPFDQYGNIKQTGSGGYSPEQREAFLNETLSDYGTNSDTGNPFTRGEVLSLTGDRKKEVDARFAEAHPIKQGFIDFAKVLAPGAIASKILGGVTSLLPKNVDLNTNVPFKETYPSGGGYYSPVVYGPGQTMYAHGPETDSGKGFPNTPPPGLQPTPSEPQGGEPQGGEPQGGGGRGDGDSGGDNGGRGVHDGGYSNSMTRSSDQGDGGGATGGLATHYGIEHMAHGGIANLHQYNLGSYSDGGRLLKGPGNGTSDDIPAIIGHNQPARLAEGEFVIPARIVSELGNGSTDAGAKQLYAMMDRIQKSRAKTVGKNKVAFDAKARNHLPA